MNLQNPKRIAMRVLPHLCFCVFMLLCYATAAQTNLGPIRTTTTDDAGRNTPPPNPTVPNTCRRYYNLSTGQETWINNTGASCGPSGGGFICGTTSTPGLPYWDGTQCAIDTGANFDPINIQWNFENIVASGQITATKFLTSGGGGVVEFQAQSPPGTVPLNKFDLFLNTTTGFIDCLNHALARCLTGVQLLGQGPVALPTSAITSGACSSTVTLTATGATTSSKIDATPASDVTGITGYAPSASGSLYVQAWPTTNTANFKVCNNTSGTITPGALTLNVAVY
jgi:hypothetical protein